MNTRKTFAARITIAFALVMIQQLVFFWLVKEYEQFLVVHLFGSLTLIAYLIASVYLWERYGTRKAIPPIIVGGGICLLIQAAELVLIAFKMDLRTTIFAMSILTILLLACFSVVALNSINREAAIPRERPDVPQRITEEERSVREDANRRIEHTESSNIKRKMPPALPK